MSDFSNIIKHKYLLIQFNCNPRSVHESLFQTIKTQTELLIFKRVKKRKFCGSHSANIESGIKWNVSDIKNVNLLVIPDGTSWDYRRRSLNSPSHCELHFVALEVLVLNLPNTAAPTRQCPLLTRLKVTRRHWLIILETRKKTPEALLDCSHALWNPAESGGTFINRKNEEAQQCHSRWK